MLHFLPRPAIAALLCLSAALASGAAAAEPAPIRTPDVSFRGHTRSVRSLSLSRDRTRLASGSGDGAVIVWDVATGREVRRWTEDLQAPVVHVAISGDGKRVAALDYNRSFFLWDVATGERLPHKPRGTWGGYFASIVADEDGSRFLIKSSNTGLSVLAPSIEQRSVKLKDRSEIKPLVAAFAFEADAVVIAQRDQPLATVSFASGSLTPFGDASQDGEPLAIGAAPDGARGLAVYHRRMVAWRAGAKTITRSPECVTLLASTSGIHSDVLVSPKTMTGLMATPARLTIWRVDADSETFHTRRHPFADVRSVALIDDQRVLIGRGDGTLELWSLDAIPPHSEDWIAAYRETLTPLLDSRRFTALDREIATLRRNRETSVDGRSRLEAAYLALATPPATVAPGNPGQGATVQPPDDAARDTRAARLERWRDSEAQSTAARVALALARLEQLKSSRVDSPEALARRPDERFGRWIDQATSALDVAAVLETKDPFVAVLRMRLGRFSRATAEKTLELLRQGQEIDPYEPSLYRQTYEETLLSGADEGVKGVTAALAKLPEEDRLEQYFLLATHAAMEELRRPNGRPSELFERGRFDLVALLRAAPVVAKRRPHESPNLQAAMYFAFLADHQATRRTLGPSAGRAALTDETYHDFRRDMYDHPYAVVAWPTGQAVQAWATREPSNEPTLTKRVAAGSISEACFCDGDRAFAACGPLDGDRTKARIYYRTADDPEFKVYTHDEPVTQIAGDPTRPRIAAIRFGLAPGIEVFFFDLTTGKVTDRIPIRGYPGAFSFTPDGKRLILVPVDGADYFVFSIERDGSIPRPEKFTLATAPNTRAWGDRIFSADVGRLYASEMSTTERNNDVAVYDLESGRLLKRICSIPSQAAGAHVVLSANEERMFHAGNFGAIAWDLKSGAEIARLPYGPRFQDHPWGAHRHTHGGGLAMTAALSPTGDWLASAPGRYHDDDYPERHNDVLLLDVNSLAVKTRFRGHGDVPLVVKFSADGRKLMSFGRDGYYHEWDVAKRLAEVGPADGAAARSGD